MPPEVHIDPAQLDLTRVLAECEAAEKTRIVVA